MSAQNLKAGLLPRHIQMMAIGGMIGTGIFKGSSNTISIAGPGVAIAYLIGGALLFFVMSALAEMACAYPTLDIRKLIQKAFGSRASFVIGWLYWIQWVLVMAVEIVAAGAFLQYWFPAVPLWVLSFIVGVCLILLNILNVKNYGELEFWLAGIKVVTLTLFIVLGGALLFGLTSGTPADFANYTQHGGFFPFGWTGVFSSLLVVLFSYGGAEMIGVTIAETKNAERVLPKVIKGVIWRVILFYVCPLLIICGLMPWNEIANQSSPFVQVLSAFGLGQAAHVMNFVMLTAVISAANSGMYVTTRMLYSLATDGQAPAAFTRLSKHGVPIVGLVVSAVCLFLGALVAYLTPSNVFSYLMGIPGFVTIVMWMSICLAQLKLRRSYTALPHYYVRLFPYTTVLTVLALFVILIMIMSDEANLISSIVCLSVLLVLTILGYARNRKKASSEKALTN